MDGNLAMANVLENSEQPIQDTILFRCSGLGKLMKDCEGITDKQLATIAELQEKMLKKPLTDKQGEMLLDLIKKRDTPPKLTDGVITHIIDVFTTEVYGRKEEAFGKALDKGNEREEDSITLLSVVTNQYFKKNNIKLTNQWIKGEPDLFKGESIRKADFTKDTKTSWSLHTFMRAKHKLINPDYYWQGMGYMMLTGSKRHSVSYCLVNGTDKAIMAEKRALSYAMGIIDPTAADNTTFIEKCKQIEINHIFDMEAFRKEYPYFQFDNNISDWHFDIPIQDRLHEFHFDRNERDIEKIKGRVTEARKWIAENLVKKEVLNAV
jgi:hypothetical protein